jgi:hypothetical protein
VFEGRSWAASKRVEGNEIDEIFDWAKESHIDIICQGVVELPSNGYENKDWYSVWSFENEDDRLMFVLRFGFEIVFDTKE